jgi:hypothetical protein
MQPHPVAHSKHHIAMRGAIVFLGQLLRLEEALMNLSEKGIVVAKENIHLVGTGGPRCI